jgi:hypothetical protein
MARAQKVGLFGALVVIAALGTHVTRWSGFEGLTIPTLVIGGAAVLLFVGVRRTGSGGVAGARTVTMAAHSRGASPSALRRTATHEGGHHHAAYDQGGYVTSAVVRADGSGLVRASLPNARAALVFLRAGQIAMGSSCGAGDDNAAFEATLKEFPRRERAQVRREVYRETRACVNRGQGLIFQGVIERAAADMLKDVR